MHRTIRAGNFIEQFVSKRRLFRGKDRVSWKLFPSVCRNLCETRATNYIGIVRWNETVLLGIKRNSFPRTESCESFTKPSIILAFHCSEYITRRTNYSWKNCTIKKKRQCSRKKFLCFCFILIFVVTNMFLLE